MKSRATGKNKWSDFYFLQTSFNEFLKDVLRL